MEASTNLVDALEVKMAARDAHQKQTVPHDALRPGMILVHCKLPSVTTTDQIGYTAETRAVVAKFVIRDAPSSTDCCRSSNLLLQRSWKGKGKIKYIEKLHRSSTSINGSAKYKEKELTLRCRLCEKNLLHQC